ncbi:hypothetical protein O9993_07630 [Vibrio lentus]|nr:hypothetical protein [Vibrio lentus]
MAAEQKPPSGSKKNRAHINSIEEFILPATSLTLYGEAAVTQLTRAMMKF